MSLKWTHSSYVVSCEEMSLSRAGGGGGGGGAARARFQQDL